MVNNSQNETMMARFNSRIVNELRDASRYPSFELLTIRGDWSVNNSDDEN
jgi:hypothetical protein